jgi:preprotein translocase subunit SecA
MRLKRTFVHVHGLSVGCIELYGTIVKSVSQLINQNITFGTNANLLSIICYDHMSMCPDDIVQSRHNFAIVDELDSVMLDNADEPHIVMVDKAIM